MKVLSDNFYPRPLRGGRRVQDGSFRLGEEISIHALCEEGDLFLTKNQSRYMISIHALCEEGDEVDKYPGASKKISIHALCEEGDKGHRERHRPESISIHALCEEGDTRTGWT